MEIQEKHGHQKLSSEARGVAVRHHEDAVAPPRENATTEERLQRARVDPPAPTANPTTNDPQQWVEDLAPEVRAVYYSWTQRRDHVANLQWHEFEDWKWDYESRFGDWQPTLNFATMIEYFESKRKLTRGSAGTKMSLGDRIRQGHEYFNPEYLLKYNPQEADNMGLFFTFLLESNAARTKWQEA